MGTSQVFYSRNDAVNYLDVYDHPKEGGKPLRRSREDATATRERVVETASHEFRANGIAEGLADVMKSAGLTHGRVLQTLRVEELVGQ